MRNWVRYPNWHPQQNHEKGKIFKHVFRFLSLYWIFQDDTSKFSQCFTVLQPENSNISSTMTVVIYNMQVLSLTKSWKWFCRRGKLTLNDFQSFAGSMLPPEALTILTFAFTSTHEINFQLYVKVIISWKLPQLGFWLKKFQTCPWVETSFMLYATECGACANKSNLETFIALSCIEAKPSFIYA